MRRKFSKNTCLRPGPVEPQKVYLRTKNSRLRAFLFIGCCLLLASCFDKGDCLFTNTTVVRIKMMDLDTPSIAHEIALDTIFIVNYGGIVVNDTITEAGVYVSPDRTEMEYYFQHDGKIDRLVLGYTNQTIVLSPDCGSYLYQNDLEVKLSTFDSVHVTNKRLLTSVTSNIEIFF